MSVFNFQHGGAGQNHQIEGTVTLKKGRLHIKFDTFRTSNGEGGFIKARLEVANLKYHGMDLISFEYPQGKLKGWTPKPLRINCFDALGKICQGYTHFYAKLLHPHDGQEDKANEVIPNREEKRFVVQIRLKNSNQSWNFQDRTIELFYVKSKVRWVNFLGFSFAMVKFEIEEAYNA